MLALKQAHFVLLLFCIYLYSFLFLGMYSAVFWDDQRILPSHQKVDEVRDTEEWTVLIRDILIPWKQRTEFIK